MALNRVIIMGRIVRDLELRQTGSGVAVTSFTVAVDRDFKGQDGEKQVDFVDVTAWRNTAEFAAKYLGKGRSIVVEGKLQFNEWKDKDGNNRRNAVVVADNIYFADSKNTNNQTQQMGGFTEIEDDGSPLPF